MTAQIDDSILAHRLAQGTGEILKGVRNVGVLRGRSLGDAGDDLAQNWIARVLEQHRPDDGFLSEEAADNPERLAKDRVWIIDPLDGTDEYGHGRTDFAVHVALWQRGSGAGGSLTDAVVDVPALGELWRTDRPRPVQALPSNRTLRIVVSRSRPPAGLGRLLEDVSADLAAAGITARGIEAANVGSVGAKLGEVMAGRAEAYLHPGGLNEWDLAAPHACAVAAGLVALGPEQPFNQMPPKAGPVLICHPALAEAFKANWH